MIEVKNLHKFFNRGKQNEIHVLNGINLSLPEQGMVAIFGRSGCGKTTLLNVLGGLDGFAGGEITLGGESIRHNPDLLRNKYVGYIFQNYNLQKSESCFDNVADALRLCGITDPTEIEGRVTAALANVDMAHYAARTPDTLSGGQQQRIAIARAIVKNPRIILADEPTGNLDEANTVMIMNLLKQISRDHLVLLVTHEAKLVDYYCDRVIELQDGNVVGDRTNVGADGLAARDKNHIYLGELERREHTDDATAVSYFGELPAEPIRLSVVNNGGKLYLRVDTPGVQLIDGTGEVRLLEGVFEEKATDVMERIDMSALPPIEGKRFGRLFSFIGSLRSGYAANFKGAKKGKKALRSCMILFAVVLVFMSAVFGTAIGDLLNARSAYNHNIFYLFTGTHEVSARINAALSDPASGIDYLRLTQNTYVRGDEMLDFHIGSFETFDAYETIRVNAVPLGASLIKDAAVAAGKSTPVDYEMVITTKVADALLEGAMVDYLKDYGDLIGLYCSGLNYMYVQGGLRVVGVVESDETAVYISDLTFAKALMQNTGVRRDALRLASDYGMTASKGELIALGAAELLQKAGLTEGAKTALWGQSFTVGELRYYAYNYQDWLIAQGIEKVWVDDYINPPGTSPEQWEDINDSPRLYNYCDYYFAEFEQYLDDCAIFNPGIELWMYREKGVEMAKFFFMFNDFVGGDEYYAATLYKQMHGRYPSRQELMQVGYSPIELKPYYVMYEYEFYNGNYNQGYVGADQIVYLLSEEDYIALSKLVPPVAVYEDSEQGKDPIPEYKDETFEKLAVTIPGASVDYIYSGDIYYTVIHSTDPQKTAAYLEKYFGDVSSPWDYRGAIITPDSLFEEIMTEIKAEIIVNLIAMTVILALMSLCMYFIMRSSLMNRIKEVGIYRAIGVSRKNLVFKFFVEALVLTTLTVLVGFTVSSLFIAASMSSSPLVSQMFFYPLWLAAGILGLLYALCLICGTLPILSLLRKTPSAILAKYDI